ncbi:hypothetical protein PTTG_03317 [Puccinia triticina 1-1 BBBD Race 1]|uniref:Uncharacterized protein n=1 Tax=Puccinia triticina (isolate 1-1 / race 1 (BBBD)) TaxID=630390 RepID=A0A180G4A0_PUCT1|nr:hypothetical protein PTTG_03317 [Puccinia triticina 1-1 BBBD Race 1]
MTWSEVPLEKLADGSSRRRRTAKSHTQERQTNENLSRMITRAADDKPHHREKVLRSLQTFARAMMGLPSNAKPQDLPDSVTSEELSNWDTWRERRKEAFNDRLKEAIKKNPKANEQEIKLIQKEVTDQLKSRLVPVTFRGSAFSATLSISLHVKRDMEADLAKAGFHRYTFDWNAKLVNDSLWNAVTVDITIRHWLPWAKRINIDVNQSALPGIKARFLEWISNQGVTQAKAQLTPPQLAAQRKRMQYVRTTKRKIANLRGDTFLGLYPEKKILGHLLRDPDAVSDFEEENPETLPRRIAAHWRSTEMEDIIRCIDHAALQRAKTTQKKMSVKGLLDRKDTRVPTSQERIDQTVPNRFPADAYRSSYLQEVGQFQAEHMTSERMGLDNLAKEMIRKSFGEGYCRPQVQGKDNSTALNPAASNQAGPSGPEVQMSG